MVCDDAPQLESRSHFSDGIQMCEISREALRLACLQGCTKLWEQGTGKRVSSEMVKAVGTPLAVLRAKRPRTLRLRRTSLQSNRRYESENGMIRKQTEPDSTDGRSDKKETPVPIVPLLTYDESGDQINTRAGGNGGGLAQFFSGPATFSHFSFCHHHHHTTPHHLTTILSRSISFSHQSSSFLLSSATCHPVVPKSIDLG